MRMNFANDGVVNIKQGEEVSSQEFVLDMSDQG